GGHLVVCEDQYTENVANHLRWITPRGEVFPLALSRLDTELAGACFSPDGHVLFVNLYSPTRTLAITGPWLRSSGQGRSLSACRLNAAASTAPRNTSALSFRHPELRASPAALSRAAYGKPLGCTGSRAGGLFPPLPSTRSGTDPRTRVLSLSNRLQSRQRAG